ncbi:hypothetical protein P170DRAFT_447520 [Aspergillus steynii IBT 23096]|uniref:Uncharacterized protein n=1 Tax=Aspergillus steynii IBT 23096 TaxID=1392250 RepID=A0A2I2G3W9_9EURO|nr:uncharacterized protein P170DRAFT_447520 [Aspergillus steynii IBT 23096]PLB47576.1 hypothetical protein P170DRAFT_447520 [Aspergillus steynii IBT 23096]
MNVPCVFRELFIRTGETSDVGVVSLRECLIEIFQNWSNTDAEGWVAPQLDFAEKQSQNKELLSMYIARMEGKESPEEARRIWPFPE